MKICVTSDGQGLDASVNPNFGRAPYFLFIESETETVEAVQNNPGAHGAGVQAAQLVADRGACVVLTGSIGPNAYQGLSAAAIEVYTGARGSVKDALEAYRSGQLSRTEGPIGGRHGGGRR